MTTEIAPTRQTYYFTKHKPPVAIEAESLEEAEELLKDIKDIKDK